MDSDVPQTNSAESVDLQRMGSGPAQEPRAERKKWLVALVSGEDWGDMMRDLRADATNIHIDAERNGKPSPWSIGISICFFSGEGGRPSIDELAELVRRSRSATDSSSATESA